MEHEQARQMMAAERYLLNELAPDVRDAFEEHLFGCQECALDVRTGAAFVDQARRELARGPVPPKSKPEARVSAKGWLGWLRPAIVIPVFAVLLAFIAYQNLAVLPGARQEVASVQVPRVLASVSLMGGATRGGTTPAITVPRSEPFLLFVDIPPDSQSASYVAELYDPAGALQWSLPISAAAARDTVSLRVPGTNHAAGLYTLVVSGVNASGVKQPAVARYPFELQFQSR